MGSNITSTYSYDDIYSTVKQQLDEIYDEKWEEQQLKNKPKSADDIREDLIDKIPESTDIPDTQVINVLFKDAGKTSKILCEAMEALESNSLVCRRLDFADRSNELKPGWNKQKNQYPNHKFRLAKRDR